MERVFWVEKDVEGDPREDKSKRLDLLLVPGKFVDVVPSSIWGLFATLEKVPSKGSWVLAR